MFGGFLLFFAGGISHATTCIAPPPPKPIHHICGVVIDPLGEPIPNAKVTILENGRELVALQTGKDGKFSFAQLQAGHYDIRVDADGFKSAGSSIVIAKPSTKCKRALQVLLDVGMGCSGISEVKLKQVK